MLSEGMGFQGVPVGYHTTLCYGRGPCEGSGDLRKWILGRGILQSYTEGDAPASNGVAEAGVKFIKRRARTLLDHAGIDKARWPDAVRTAALEQRAAKLGIP